MRKSMFGLALGLATLGGNLALSAPAHAAIQWRNFASNVCLAVAGASQNIGASVIVATCEASPSASQRWYSSNVPNTGYYYFDSGLFTGSAPDKVIGVAQGVMNNGTSLITWTKQTTSAGYNQQWEWVSAFSDGNGNSCYYFKNRASPANTTKVMGVLGGVRNPGTAVGIWDWFKTSSGGPDFNGHPDQYWCVY